MQRYQENRDGEVPVDNLIVTATATWTESTLRQYDTNGRLIWASRGGVP